MHEDMTIFDKAFAGNNIRTKKRKGQILDDSETLKS